MMLRLRSHSRVLVCALALLAPGVPAGAQPAGGSSVPNALQGFSQNKGQPIHIESATLEVRDKEKIATFSGDVRVRQGDTNLRCKSLLVFYDQQNDPNSIKTSPSSTGGQQQIRRLEARGGVVVTQKDQTATGETAIFDMPTNTVTLHGNVLVTQGQNVLRGDRLVVDLTSGVSRVESGKPGQGGGRVQGLFLPGGSQASEKGGKETKPAAREAPRARPQAPQGLY
jgi:lipopolysaccharide export system protein LptA